jgi:hypothetical protein
MPNPLDKAVKSGIRMNDRIGNLFARIGTSAHPRGDVLTDYDLARLSLESALAKENPLPAVRDVLRGLRRQLNADVTGVLNEAVSLGEDEASRQLRFYNARPRGSIRLTEQSNSALEAAMSQFDAQAAAITALVLSQADPAQIIGDEDRTGILSSGIVITAAAYWATHLVWTAFDTQVTSQDELFQKQAVAALDARTTDCCLRVHGQIVELDEPFHLTGTPRFADDMDWPAFHWYCRTSGVLYQPEFDDGLTDKMQEGSQFFLDEREKGKSPDNNPVDAFQ